MLVLWYHPRSHSTYRIMPTVITVISVGAMVTNESSCTSSNWAHQTVQRWRELAQECDFNADTNIIDLEAHYTALVNLERSVSRLYTDSEMY